ncbi:adenine methyltransferase [Ectothiorhodospira shaposhnikovii]|uniref:DNA N-6-adenine-methyltransferase n=1 Tax=Ectothiorhodospira shaposhnikovii TaxID=1054 RepID=UPI0019077375|nr:DNA N-6-adenine-methyltransferase [Ectothiorhodospira shaposhnikovii]MBK1674710.1 adenine methyltransferase [Ectothiorhodospira shaposhnikovii]
MAIGGHHSPVALKDEWLTPPDILDALGSFDLDPCSPINRPWPTAAAHYTILDDGLKQPWHGRVWCNPPYGLEAAKWLDRLADHGDGIALIFARTETTMFFEHVWAKASALLFIRGRLHFRHVNGQRAKANGGAPSVLVAYGERNAAALRNCGIDGHLVMLDATQLTMR